MENLIFYQVLLFFFMKMCNKSFQYWGKNDNP